MTADRIGGALQPLATSAHAQARSGAAAVIAQCEAIDAAIKHAENLQAAVNEIRELTAGRPHSVGSLAIWAILERHNV